MKGNGEGMICNLSFSMNARYFAAATLLASIAAYAFPVAAQVAPPDRRTATPAEDRQRDKRDQAQDRKIAEMQAYAKRRARENDVKFNGLDAVVTKLAANTDSSLEELMEKVDLLIDRIAIVEKQVGSDAGAQNLGNDFSAALTEGDLDRAARLYEQLEKRTMDRWYADQWQGIEAMISGDASPNKEFSIAALESYVAYYPSPDNVGEARQMLAELVKAKDEAERLAISRTPWLAGSDKLTTAPLKAAATLVAISDDGRYIALGQSNGNIDILELGTRRPLASVETRPNMILSLMFSPDGRRLLTAETDGVARIRNWQSKKEIAALSGHDGKTRSARFSPDGKFVVTSGGDERVIIWDADDGRLLSTFLDESACLKKEKADRQAAAARNLFYHGESCYLFGGFNPAKKFAEFNRDMTRILILSKSLTEQYEYPSAAFYGSPAVGKTFPHWNVHLGRYSPDGSLIYAQLYSEMMGGLYDAKTNRQSCALAVQGGSYGIAPTAVEFTRDGKFILLATSQNSVEIFKTDCSHLVTLTGPSRPVTSLALTPDGRTVAAVDGSANVHIWVDKSRQ
jgi:WD domain, G-beta repeat